MVRAPAKLRIEHPYEGERPKLKSRGAHGSVIHVCFSTETGTPARPFVGAPFGASDGGEPVFQRVLFRTQ